VFFKSYFLASFTENEYLTLACARVRLATNQAGGIVQAGGDAV